MPPRFFVPLTCVIATLGIAACGGDDDPGGGSGSDEEFIVEADELCKEAAREIVATQGLTNPSVEESIAQLDEQMAIRSRALEDLRALGDPPSTVAEPWDEFLTRREQRIDVVGEEIGLLEDGVKPAAPEYQEVIAKSIRIADQTEASLEGTDFEACASRLPKDVEEEAVAIATEFETQPLDDCSEFMTDSAIIELFGGLQECQATQKNPPPEGSTKEVDVTDVSGIEELSVSIDASLTVGIGDGEDVIYGLVYEDGTYKVSSVTLQPER